MHFQIYINEHVVYTKTQLVTKKLLKTNQRTRRLLFMNSRAVISPTAYQLSNDKEKPFPVSWHLHFWHFQTYSCPLLAVLMEARPGSWESALSELHSALSPHSLVSLPQSFHLCVNAYGKGSGNSNQVGMQRPAVGSPQSRKSVHPVF